MASGVVLAALGGFALGVTLTFAVLRRELRLFYFESRSTSRRRRPEAPDDEGEVNER